MYMMPLCGLEYCVSFVFHCLELLTVAYGSKDESINLTVVFFVCPELHDGIGPGAGVDWFSGLCHLHNQRSKYVVS